MISIDFPKSMPFPKIVVWPMYHRSIRHPVSPSKHHRISPVNCWASRKICEQNSMRPWHRPCQRVSAPVDWMVYLRTDHFDNPTNSWHIPNCFCGLSFHWIKKLRLALMRKLLWIMSVVPSEFLKTISFHIVRHLLRTNTRPNYITLFWLLPVLAEFFNQSYWVQCVVLCVHSTLARPSHTYGCNEKTFSSEEIHRIG